MAHRLGHIPASFPIVPMRHAVAQRFPAEIQLHSAMLATSDGTAARGWIHEIKHDGFRILARRQADRVRLVTRNGYDFTARYPKIVTAVESLPVNSCPMDGEAIVVDERGLSVFDVLRYRLRDDAAVLCAFDLIELDGDDLRWQPLEHRKATLADFVPPERCSWHHCTAQFSQEAGAMAQSPCPTCAGSGKCPGCDGVGLLADENPPAAQPSGADRTCPGCGGSGKCPTCKGSGLTGPSSSET